MPRTVSAGRAVSVGRSVKPGRGNHSAPPPATPTTLLEIILARTGVVGAWLFGAGADLTDRSTNHNNGTWTTGTPTNGPSPTTETGERATLLADTDEGTIPHIAAYNFGDGPWAVEFWTDSASSALANYIVRKSNGTTDGWGVYASGTFIRLVGPDGTSNIRSATAVPDGQHHIVISRGTGTYGHVYVDGVSVADTSNAMTFTNSAEALKVLANGSLYGLVLYNRELTAGEAAQDAAFLAPPIELPPDAPPPPDLLIEGFGKDCLVGLGTGTYVVSSLASGTAAGTFGGALNWLRNGNKGTITFSVNGTIPVGVYPAGRIEGCSNFFIDGRTANITFTGGPIWFENCHHYAVVNVRHRGGLEQDQSNDDFTNAGGNHDYAYANCSFSGAGDEGCSSTRNSYNFTVQDCLWGAGTIGHNYGSLNGSGTYQGSFIRCTFLGTIYRCPQVESGVYDIVNNIMVGPTSGESFGVCIFSSGKANVRNSYFQGVTDPVSKDSTGGIYHTGTVLVSSGAMPAINSPGSVAYTIPAANQVTPLSVSGVNGAINRAKNYGGCLPHDSFDTTLLARIT